MSHHAWATLRMIVCAAIVLHLTGCAAKQKLENNFGLKIEVAGDFDATVTETQLGVKVTTKRFLAVKGLKTDAKYALDPADPNWNTTRKFHYEYSFMLVKGSATIHPDKTLELEEGELYVQSKVVYDDNAGVPASPQAMIFFPLITKKVVQTGSVSTEYIVRCFDSTVEVSYRSVYPPATGLFGVWSRFTPATSLSPDPPVRLTANNHVRAFEEYGEYARVVDLDWGQDARFAYLRAQAHAFGVKD
jgi:hypothetical protein